MNARDLLKVARDIGVTIQVDGNQLILQATTRPPDGLLRELARSKTTILRHLRVTSTIDTGTVGEAAESTLTGERFEERAALVEDGAGVPRAWAEGFARLDLATPPNGFDHARWRTLIDDGGRFLDQWGAEAAELGWSAEDIFGVHPLAPGARYDTAGLTLLIGGGQVVAIDVRSASIRRASSGAVLVYLRTPRQGAIAVWELESRGRKSVEPD